LIREFSGDSDSVSTSLKIVGIASLENEVDITALACHPSGDCVACGKENGAVTLYTTQSGIESHVLYRHAEGIAINFLIFGNNSELIVSADASSRCMVWRVVRRENVWSAEGPLLDVRVQDYSINHILFDSANRRLLLSTIVSDTVYDIGTGLHKFSAFQERKSWKWIDHPRDSKKLIHLTASTARIHAWDDVSESHTCATMNLASDMSNDMYLKDVAVCSDGCNLSIVFAKGDDQKSTSQVLIVPVSLFEEPLPDTIKSLALFDKVAAEIEHIIGSLGKTLLFLDRRLWVCSLDLEKFKGEYYRHFFIPEDWLSINRKLILRVTSKGDLVFVKKHEVAIVKNGLENKETITVGTG
jgi:WD40 repeat protein